MNVLQEIFSDLDVIDKKLSENEIFARLADIKPNLLTEQERIEFDAEILAFSLRDISQDQVTEEKMDYWCKRINEVTHPVLKIRYATLIQDLYKCVKKENPPFQTTCVLIDSCDELARKHLHTIEIDEIHQLKTALQLAISIGDSKRIEKIKNTILDYEKNYIKGDRAVNAWALLLDCLLVNKKAINLTADEECELIARTENRLVNLVSLPNDAIDFGPSQEAAKFLAKYYFDKQEHVKKKEVLLKYFSFICSQAVFVNPIQAQVHLMEADKIGNSFNHKNDLKNELENIRFKLEEVSRRLPDVMQQVSITTTVETKEINIYISQMTQGTLDECLHRLAYHFIPQKQDVEQQVRELMQKAPISYTIPITITAPDGRPLAIIQPEDFNGHVILQTAQNIYFMNKFMRLVIEQIVKKHSPSVEMLTNYLFRSPIFAVQNRAIIEEGLEAYLNGKSISAIHTLIPQCEDALRNLLIICGEFVTKPARNGGYNLKMLENLIDEKIVMDLFGADTVFYFKVAFTDQRSLNFRNDVCHGCAEVSKLRMEMADRVFHALLILSERSLQLTR